MKDQIFDLLGWEEDTQERIRQLSKGDLSSLMAVPLAHEGKLKKKQEKQNRRAD